MHHDSLNYKLLQAYYKLQQKIITNYGSFIKYYSSGLLQIMAVLSQITVKKLLQITTKSYYKLRQLLFLKNSKLLQITLRFITYYGSF